MDSNAPNGVDAVPPPTVEGIDEQDFECDPVGSADYVKRLVRPKGGRVPQILWGDTFKTWTEWRQLKYAKELASSLNEALKQEQAEKLEVIQAALRQEETIKSLIATIEDNNDTTQRVVTKLSGKADELTKQVAQDGHRLTRLRLLVKKIREFVSPEEYLEARAYAEGQTVEEYNASLEAKKGGS